MDTISFWSRKDSMLTFMVDMYGRRNIPKGHDKSACFRNN